MATFEIYRDARHEYRRRLRAGNRRIIADSGAAYVTQANCRRAFATVQRTVAQATLKT